MNECQLARPPDEGRIVAALRRLSHFQQAVGRHQLGLPFQLERSDWLGLDGITDEGKRV